MLEPSTSRKGPGMVRLCIRSKNTKLAESFHVAHSTVFRCSQREPTLPTKRVLVSHKGVFGCVCVQWVCCPPSLNSLKVYSTETWGCCCKGSRNDHLTIMRSLLRNCNQAPYCCNTRHDARSMSDPVNGLFAELHGLRLVSQRFLLCVPPGKLVTCEIENAILPNSAFSLFSFLSQHLHLSRLLKTEVRLCSATKRWTADNDGMLKIGIGAGHWLKEGASGPSRSCAFDHFEWL